MAADVEDSPENRAPPPVWRRALNWTLALGLLGGLVWWGLRSIDFRQFWDTVKQSDWPILLLAGVIALTVCMGASSTRLWLLTRVLPQPKWALPLRLPSMVSIYIASNAAHHLLPAPAAEVLRTVYLKRRYGYTYGGLVASQIVERIVDALGLGLEVLAVAALGGLPQAMRLSLLIFAAAALAGAGLALFFGARYRHDGLEAAHDAGRVRRFLRNLGHGMSLMKSPRMWAQALGCSLVNDLANAATVGLVAHAVGVPLSVGEWFVVVLVARMAGLLPSTPGQFGVIEGGLVVALSAMGVETARGLAVAVLYHAAHFFPITLVGLWELKRTWSLQSTTAEMMQETVPSNRSA